MQVCVHGSICMGGGARQSLPTVVTGATLSSPMTKMCNKPVFVQSGATILIREINNLSPYSNCEKMEKRGQPKLFSMLVVVSVYF